MNKKLFYTQPTTDLLEVEVEGLVCLSNFGQDNAPGIVFSSGEGTIISIDDDF